MSAITRAGLRRCSRSIASSPLFTAITSTPSSEKVSAMIFCTVALSSASKILYSTRTSDSIRQRRFLTPSRSGVFNYSTSIRRCARKQAFDLDTAPRSRSRAAPYRGPDVTRFGKGKAQKERKRPFSLLLYFLPSLWRRSLFGNAGRIFLLFPFLLRIFLFLVFLFRLAVISFGSRRLVGFRRIARLAGRLSGGGG